MHDIYLEKTSEIRSFFTVLVILYQDKLQKLIDDANTKRLSKQDVLNDDLIKFTSEIVQAINNVLV